MLIQPDKEYLCRWSLFGRLTITSFCVLFLKAVGNCSCESGYTGPNCETLLVNKCENVTCLNGGTCRQQPSNTSYLCQCNTGTAFKGFGVFNVNFKLAVQVSLKAPELLTLNSFTDVNRVCIFLSYSYIW